MPSAVTCGDCGAQFELTQTFWEERVARRVVAVRCKRCGAKIRVDGRNPEDAPEHSKPPSPSVRERLTSVVEVERGDPEGVLPTETYVAPPATPNEPSVWLISYQDDDDRELDEPQIAAALAKGEITLDTIAWRDGMADWLPLRDIPSLSALSTAPIGAAAGAALSGLSLTPTPALTTARTPATPGATQRAPVAAQAPAVERQPLAEPNDEEEAPASLAPESLEPESLDPVSLAANELPAARPAPPAPPPRRAPAASAAPQPAERPAPRRT